ncbi:twin-arginine translocase subunit TatC [Natranaerobius thermophilus]|uniref:Sec-independent protein translocase protein TatC n=1 Tax=Natranaerobius thermophilus (strain ATCC BAA-1301 / DSM 18059 / JW/NM-WN-LF) TaxID=457570 RepID=B2A204_NATTJ|nr:twin-arginine translocase subunit TatC [Natranaerobius thermophilus]ACB84809.1 Sec-independent protein translocase, TatC subunit [Natranaerobius thermophilus JW/NM-WN-LF]
MSEQRDKMSFTDHLGELRQRLIWIVLAFLIATGIAFYFSETLLDIITVPADNLHYISPAEAFLSQLKLAIIAGLVFSLPVTLYQLIAFVLPALEPGEKKYLFIFLPLALILFVLGVLFAYFVILPLAYRFFINFAREDLLPMITVRSYVSFALGLLLPFGLVFQLPLIVTILSNLELITPEFLRTNRKIAVLITFVIGSFLTPPDLISQGLLAGPLIILYESSIMVSKFIYRRKNKHTGQAA